LLAKLTHNLVNRTGLKSFLTANRVFVRSYFNYKYLRADPYQLVQNDERRKIERAFSLLDGFHAEKALELGCGEGRWTAFTARIADEVLAIDLSDLAIRRARAKNLANVEFRQGDLTTIGLPPASFDFVFCSEVLYYLSLDQLEKTVARVEALLRPGGRLLLVHARALKDDERGLELKEFGAKTIHDRFAASGLDLETDVLDDLYRISVYRR